MRMTHILASCAMALAVGMPALAQAPLASEAESQQIEGIAAIVNDYPISYSDVRQRAQLLLLSIGAQPSQEEIQQIASQALQQLIDERLQLQEAGEYEVEIEEDEIAASIEDMAAQSGATREELYRQLLSNGVNPTSLEEQMRAEIAWRRIMGGLYGSRIRISDNQINDQLSRLQSAAQETQYLVSEIFLYAPDPTSQQQAMEAAVSIRGQLLQGAQFQVAAQRFSSAPTAATGGDMGWVSLEDLDTEVATALTAMPGPGVTEPIAIDTGIYLIGLRDRRDPQAAVSQVSLTRLFSPEGDAQALSDAIAEITGCDDIDSVAQASGSLQAAALGRISTDQLADDAAARIDATPVGSASAQFASGNGLAVMYVCERSDSLSNMPSTEQIENQLYGQQLGMVSERALRNLRREATIIQRN